MRLPLKKDTLKKGYSKKIVGNINNILYNIISISIFHFMHNHLSIFLINKNNVGGETDWISL